MTPLSGVGKQFIGFIVFEICDLEGSWRKIQLPNLMERYSEAFIE